MAPLSQVVGVLGLAAGSLALRLDSDDQPQGAPACVPPEPYKQQLTNVMDLQYFTELTVGGQKITGLLDTTSFELLVFSSQCATCGDLGAYDAGRSPTFVRGAVNKTYYHGTGFCQTARANDTAQVGCYSSQHQAMWLADKCHVPWGDHGFQSIVGLGPPGQPVQAASEALEQLEKMEQAFRDSGRVVTEQVDQEARAKIQAELDDALRSKALLDNLGMRAFSVCLGKAAGSPAWMVWNDVTREHAPGTLRLPAVGHTSWGLQLQRMALEFPPSSDISSTGEVAVGCENGCGAVVDTGSSLHGVSSTIYSAIAAMLDEHLHHSSCDDLSAFPTLVVTVEGHELRLPPSSYIGKVYDQPTTAAAGFMRMTGRVYEQGCELLLLELGPLDTQFGPAVVLGTPFFREYYTTFDLGSLEFGTDPAQRAIFVTPAGESCDPDQSASARLARDGEAGAPRHASFMQVEHGARDREAVTPRQVSLAHVRVPHWLHNRTGIDI